MVTPSFMIKTSSKAESANLSPEWPVVQPGPRYEPLPENIKTYSPKAHQGSPKHSDKLPDAHRSNREQNSPAYPPQIPEKT